jgi:hypothetical protein
MTDPAVPAGIPAPMLHVFGAGFGRSGTLSMREGLVHLGFAPCDHMLAGLSLRGLDVVRLIAGRSRDSCQFGMIHHPYLQAEVSRSRLAAQAVATNKRSVWRRARVWRQVQPCWLSGRESWIRPRSRPDLLW